MSRGSPCFSSAGVHPHQNFTASARSFQVSLPSCSKHRQQPWPCNAPHHSSCWWGLLSYPRRCLLRWGCPNRVERQRWQAAESCKMPTSQLPYDFVRELIFVREDIVQLCACILLLAMELNEADVLSHGACSPCTSQPSWALMLLHKSPQWGCCCLTSHACRDRDVVLSPVVKGGIEDKSHKVLYKAMTSSSSVMQHITIFLQFYC